MKKLFIGLFLLLFFCVAGAVGTLYYIRPDIGLNLEHRPVPVKQRVLSMVERRSLELVLTEEDINNVIKESLSRNPRRSKDIEVQGAQFSLSGNILTADYSLKWKQRVTAALRVTYLLSWNDPDIIGTVTDVRVKDISLPTSLAENIALPIGEQLPKPLKIKNVAFGDHEVKIAFQKPTLEDLRQLIR
ncbi:hypothetical protein E5161_16695 [Cohnella pontilimi]|uniref:DUF2140 family protein n=1 Tax=Cohnella pontilimi TaxID=2564100 RepID=A0A4U0F839_9BACL|nr:hypothetical protein [Cohnella pontilimi]TJY40781.1 hypothetical protein E5161_16695 [Cohnella pontilimi]